MEACKQEIKRIQVQRTSQRLYSRNRVFDRITCKINQKNICNAIAKGILDKKKKAHLLCLRTSKNISYDDLRTFAKAWINHINLPYKVYLERDQEYLEIMVTW